MFAVKSSLRYGRAVGGFLVHQAVATMLTACSVAAVTMLLVYVMARVLKLCGLTCRVVIEISDNRITAAATEPMLTAKPSSGGAPGSCHECCEMLRAYHQSQMQRQESDREPGRDRSSPDGRNDACTGRCAAERTASGAIPKATTKDCGGSCGRQNDATERPPGSLMSEYGGGVTSQSGMLIDVGEVRGYDCWYRQPLEMRRTEKDLACEVD